MSSRPRNLIPSWPCQLELYFFHSMMTGVPSNVAKLRNPVAILSAEIKLHARLSELQVRRGKNVVELGHPSSSDPRSKLLRVDEGQLPESQSSKSEDQKNPLMQQHR